MNKQGLIIVGSTFGVCLGTFCGHIHLAVGVKTVLGSHFGW